MRKTSWLATTSLLTLACNAILGLDPVTHDTGDGSGGGDAGKNGVGGATGSVGGTGSPSGGTPGSGTGGVATSGGGGKAGQGGSLGETGGAESGGTAGMGEAGAPSLGGMGGGAQGGGSQGGTTPTGGVTGTGGKGGASQGGSVGTGGTLATGGTPGAGGKSGTGGSISAGGSVSTGGKSSTGGTVGTGGTTGGTVGTGGTTGGTVGTGGTTGGSAPSIGAFDGFLFQSPCGGPSSGDDCANVNCTAGVKDFQQTFVLTGQTGTTYNVTFRVRGVVETKNYTDSTRRAGNAMDASATGGDFWGVGGTVPTSLYEVYELQVSPPVSGAANVYYLNVRNGTPEGHDTWALNYTATIQVPSGGSIRFRNYDGNCRKMMNCGPGSGVGANCAPRILDLTGASPAAPGTFSQPYMGFANAPGQWLFFDVTSITPSS